MFSTPRRALVAAAVILIGVAQPSFCLGKNWSRLRVQQHEPVQNIRQSSNAHAPQAGERPYAHGTGRSLKSTRDPQCTMPLEDPCTLNTTAIGMLESGSATYYDEDCESGFQGCFTDGVRECRTCYLSTEVYMSATNATEANRPDWAMCPCCVPTTLQDSHVDIEVMNFNYTIFGISEAACTDAPTQAPAPTAPTMAPAPTVGAPSPLATIPPTPPTAAAPTPVPAVADSAETPAPEAGTRAFITPAPSTDGTPSPTAIPPSSTEATPTPTVGAATDATTENLDNNDGDGGLSTGAKIGIGAGAAVGVIIIGAAGFGIMKASRRGS